MFLSFKHAGTSEERWWPFFVLGNLVAMASNVFLPGLYSQMNPNVALGVGLGGAFFTGQLALTWVYHSRLSVIQWIAIGLLTVGLLLLAGGKGAEV